MANFDVSFLNPKLRKSTQNYGFLVDQLDIKQNQLESDGKLSPGDYGVLIKNAQQIYSHPGLSPAQRSNIEVKISAYKQGSQNTALKDNNDISRLNTEVKDDFLKNSMLFGNNPSILLKANSDVMRMKLDQLSNSIDSLSNAGDNAANHISEYNDTLNQYNDVLQALDNVKNHQPGQKPTSDYVAYVTTNSNGEIINVDVGKTGSKTGYAETNGLYGGLQIYGKVNRKEFGKNVFKLGNTTFSGSDLSIQDPDTPGAFRSAPLLAQGTSSGKNFGVIKEQYHDVDLNSVRTQSYIPAGKWAEGGKGFLYQRGDDGKYKKFVNADKTQLGISDNDIIRIPRVMEENLLSNVSETIDGSKPFMPSIDSSSSQNPTQGVPAPDQTAQKMSFTPGGTSRTPSPVQRAPIDIKGVAGKALNAGKGILNYIFGGD